MRYIPALIFILNVLVPSHAFAAAAIARQQQMKNAQQQAQVEAYQQAMMQAQQQQQEQQIIQYQQMVMQQAIQERIAQEVQAYMQAQQMQQLAVAQQQMVQQAVAQELAQRMAQAQVAQVQEAMIQQAVASAVQRTIVERQAQEMVMYQQAVMQQAVQQRIAEEVKAYVVAKQIQAAQGQAFMQAVAQELAQRMAQAKIQQANDAMIMQAAAAVNQRMAGNAVAAVQGAYMVQKANKAQEVVVRQNQQDIAAVQGVLLDKAIAEHTVVEAAQVMAIADQQKKAAMVNQIKLNDAVAQKQYEVAIAQQLGARAAANIDKPFEPVTSSEVKDIVDIGEVWKSLEKNSKAWTLLIDNQARVATVSEYLERFRKQGVRISQNATYYAHTLDSMILQNPAMLDQPFKQLLEIAAIVDYDFDIGMDKDQLARQMLGEEGYRANRKRLGR